MPACDHIFILIRVLVLAWMVSAGPSGGLGWSLDLWSSSCSEGEIVIVIISMMIYFIIYLIIKMMIVGVACHWSGCPPA